jgi:hypothetical protein
MAIGRGSMMADWVDDIMGELDMIHENLYWARENVDNPVLKRKIRRIMEQLSQLMDELEDIAEEEDFLESIKNKPNYQTYTTHSNAFVDEQGRGRKAKRQQKLFTKEGKLTLNTYD